jgi:hypothetical protein
MQTSVVVLPAMREEEIHAKQRERHKKLPFYIKLFSPVLNSIITRKNHYKT